MNMKNQFSERMSNLSDSELENVLAQRNDWQPEAVEAAENEAKKRRLLIIQDEQYNKPTNVNTQKENQNFTSNKSETSNSPTSLQTDNPKNKIVNVTLIGGIIGLLASSPKKSLNNTISNENANGWRVIQVIPADSGNIFLIIFRLLILLITFFLYTTANGYYIVMEKK